MKKLNQKELRVLIEHEAQLIESNQINEFAGASIFTTSIKNMLKSAGLMIPGIDIILGTLVASYDLLNIKDSTDKVIASSDIVGDQLIQKLAASDEEWMETVNMIQALPQDQRFALMESFDELLSSLKDLVLTIIQSYDSVAAAPVAIGTGAATFGGGTVATEAGVNLTTGLASVIASVMPIEKFLFSAGAKIAGALSWIFDFFNGSDPEKLKRMEENGGSVMSDLIASPYQTIERFGILYDALHDEGESALSAVDAGQLMKTAGVDPEVADNLMKAKSAVMSESRMIKLAGIK